MLTASATAVELIAELGCNQSTVSRSTTSLRTLGLVETSGVGRSATFTATHRDELLAILLAADRLAETVIQHTADLQAERSTETRRIAVRPAADAPTTEQSGGE